MELLSTIMGKKSDLQYSWTNKRFVFKFFEILLGIHNPKCPS